MNVIKLTANAAAQLRALIEEKGFDTKTSGLRLSVEKGGCAGMQYAMTSARRRRMTSSSRTMRASCDSGSLNGSTLRDRLRR
jgi:Fe-S cluster assembly iron-binding protein IscA